MWDGRFPRLHENIGEEKKFLCCRDVEKLIFAKNAGEGEKNARTKDKEGVGVGLKVMMRAKKRRKAQKKGKGIKIKSELHKKIWICQ